jgi:hypothetical protein
VFFDNLSALTQAGRFSVRALNASNLAQSILQAAKVAVSNVTIVSSAITVTETVFNAFVEQYAFSPYLFKIRALTWQALDKHSRDNNAKLATLNVIGSPDAYCSAYVLVQQHASICTLSYIQMLFDRRSRKTPRWWTPATRRRLPRPRPPSFSLEAPGTRTFPRRPAPILPASPSYTVQ